MIKQQTYLVIFLLSSLLLLHCKNTNPGPHANTTQTNQNPGSSEQKKQEDDFIKAVTGTWCSPGRDIDELKAKKKAATYFLKKDTCDEKEDEDIIQFSDIEKKDTYYIVKNSVFDVTLHVRAQYSADFEPARIIVTKFTENDIEFFLTNKYRTKFIGKFSQDKKKIIGSWTHES